MNKQNAFEEGMEKSHILVKLDFFFLESGDIWTEENSGLTGKRNLRFTASAFALLTGKRLVDNGMCVSV